MAKNIFTGFSVYVMYLDNIQTNTPYNLSFAGRNLRSLAKNCGKYSYKSELKNTYNNLWKELDLPENLKPPIQYRAMFAEMLFSCDDYSIYVNKNISERTMNIRNRSGKNKALLRHEIEHVMQIWDIIRLKGAKETLGTNRFNRQARKVEKTLGRLNPESEEGRVAEEYYKAFINYTGCNKVYPLLSIRELIDFYKYYFNILEKNARKAEKMYEPGIIKRLKSVVKEYFVRNK